ncbi:IPT/TIG domain-containing protein [Spirosoma aerolatum]|uniref:IPT/TIG domain-containing protein n=1 Tax=Spirosoma aerolatum TaxID=1211326 RepID=UPI001FE6FD6D|nr:IPT/TIG domain-containing protein [Spirosoma aerolatum]
MDHGSTSGGESLTLTGTNFGTSSGRINFGSQAASILKWSDTLVVCKVPVGQGTAIPIAVETSGKAISNTLLFSYDAPSLSTISSVSGLTTGGTSVTLTGTNFGLSAQVNFGNIPATLVNQSHTQLVVMIPPSQIGQQPVVVSVDRQMSNPLNFTYIAPPPPVLTALKPNHGPTAGGTVVTITGLRMGSQMGSVTMGSSTMTVKSWSDTLVKGILPAGQGINQSVVVTRSDWQASSSLSFNYDVPEIANISPAHGPTSGGTSLTLTGSNFGMSGIVTIDGVEAPVVSGQYSHSSVVVSLPTGQGTNLSVSILVGGQTSSKSVTFSYDAPMLNRLSPASGLATGGTSVTLTGTSFGQDAQVSFGNSSATVISRSHTQLVVINPPGQSGAQLVVVTVGGQTSNLLNFTYTAPPSPMLTDLKPNHGPTAGGGILTVSGVRFGSQAGSLKMGAIAIPITSWSDTLIQAILPAGQGSQSVSIIRQDGQASSNSLSFTYDVPILSSMSPNYGPTSGTTSLTLLGNNFGNGGTITIGGQEASLKANSWTHTSIECFLPVGQGTDQPVRILRSDGQQSNSLAFNYNAPTLTSLSSTTGIVTGGTSVTLNGTSFGTSAQVSFGVSSATIVSQSHTQLVAISPPGQLGLQPVRVTVVGQTSNPLNFSFTAPSPPVLTTLTPNHGPTSGGTSLTLVGSQFGSLPGQVSLNGTALSITSWLDTQVQCILIAGQGTGQSLVLTRADGLVSNPLSFSYDAPMVTQLSPASGLSTGGTSVTLTGANFGQSAQVSFGASSATVVSQSHTQLVVISPPGQVGPQAVVVSVGAQTASPRSFTYLASSIAVKVQSLDGDNGQPNNNSINPTLRLVNTGTGAISYTDLTVRYWFTAENYAGINTWIDYAQIGSNRVKMKYVRLDKPYQGADGYIEYSFDPSTGSLPSGANSGPIQSRLANQNWALFNELDDYSFQATSAYFDNVHITVYRSIAGGVPQLVWGTEPVPATPITRLVVQSENKNSTATGNQISTYLKINNVGNTSVSYGDLTMRYWFTKDGTAKLNYWIDYAELGAANVTGEFINVSPVRSGSDTYLEFGFKSSLGALNQQASTGSVQFRVAKSDWSSFNEANDYSYRPNGRAADNPLITLYYKGQLVYGTEPSSGARLAAEKETNGFQIRVLTNPTHTDQAEIEVIGVQGQRVYLTMTDWQGRLIDEQHQEAATPVERYTLNFQKGTAGLYILRVSNATESRSVKLVKVN